jgi:hypothetical protein
MISFFILFSLLEKSHVTAMQVVRASLQRLRTSHRGHPVHR